MAELAILAGAVLALGFGAGFVGIRLHLARRRMRAEENARYIVQQLVVFLVEAVSPRFREDLRISYRIRPRWQRDNRWPKLWDEIVLALEYSGRIRPEDVRTKVRGQLRELLREPELKSCLMQLEYRFIQEDTPDDKQRDLQAGPVSVDGRHPARPAGPHLRGRMRGEYRPLDGGHVRSRA